MSTKIVKLALSETTYNFDILYSYIVPEELRDLANVGVRVSVPFGGGDRLQVGLVLEVDYLDRVPSNYKKIYSIEDTQPIMTPEQIQLVYHLVETTLCTHYEAIRTILPPTYTMKVGYSYSLNLDKVHEWFLDDDEVSTIEMLKSKKSAMAVSKFVETNKGTIVIKSLLQKGIISADRVVDSKSLDGKSKMITLSDHYLNNMDSIKLTSAQKRVVEFMEENGTVSCKEAEYSCRVSISTINKLEKLEVINVFEYQSTNYTDVEYKRSKLVLTPKQREVYNTIATSLDIPKSECYLLHGVTGSGKTAIFEKLIEKCIHEGKTAILLVPEIALTPQMVSRFRGAFGKRVALIHSGLSLKQREDEYCRIRDGMADIVIGTRSAIFAPLKDIGIIIMDEEGEATYKSERSPRYSAKDVARFRCKNHNAVLLLASATPSVESYYLAQRGVYKLLTLDHRYNNQALPNVTLIDMKLERKIGNTLEISNKLMLELLKNLERGEQSILLLNRRGYNTSIMCLDCGKAIECVKCSVPLTYHKANHSLMCHYCGYSIDEIKQCPKCGSYNVRYTGFGTQKVFEELSEMFPTARILRMDTDTTFSRFSHEKSFKAFSNGEYDILIGTQMVGKGLDFPNVTLVGVVSADAMLYTGDFRSYEKTFSLITQVIGRCGRGDKLGRAILQTSDPSHYIIPLAVKQDYLGFYQEEIALRKLSTFPPICDICTIGFLAVEESTVQTGCNQFMAVIKYMVSQLNGSMPLVINHPIKFTHERIDGKYRYKVTIKCKNNQAFRNFLREVLQEFFKHNIVGLHIFVDINGEVY